MINPFQITKPVEPSEVIDREEETDRLRALAEEGNNARLVAPRRYGKTSLLGRVQVGLREANWMTVYVDLLGIVTLEDFAARIERSYTDQLKGPVARWFTGLRRSLRPTLTLGGGPLPASGSVDLSGRAKEALVDRLALPVAVFEKTGQRVHVVFDEFQELDEVDEKADAVVRSEIQHHGEAASYVFAGSQRHMMEMMFTDRSRAFYGQTELVSLAPLQPIALAEYISDRFESSGKEVMPAVLDGLLALVQGHPQRAMVASHALWNVTRTTADVEEWEIARTALMDGVEDELKATWLELNAPERQVLVAVAHDAPPYQQSSSSHRGGAVARALVNLEDRGLLIQRDARRRVVDPLLAEWVRAQRSTS